MAFISTRIATNECTMQKGVAFYFQTHSVCMKNHPEWRIKYLNLSVSLYLFAEMQIMTCF